MLQPLTEQPQQTVQHQTVESLLTVPLVSGMIRKIGPRKWRLYSKDGTRNLGTYSSRAGALKRERQVQYFKYKAKFEQLILERVMQKLALFFFHNK